MPELDYKPHCIALFLNESTSNFYTELSPVDKKNILDKFLSTNLALFPNLILVTNWKDLSSDNFGLDIPVHCITAFEENEFFSKLLNFLPPSQMDNDDWDEVCFLYYEGLAPLLDLEILKNIWKRHKKYLSQYSYSENLPPGLVPKVLTREFLNSLPREWKGSSHDYFLKNINQYDVEIYYHPPDLRQYRFSLYPNDARSYHLVSSIFKKYPNSNEWKYENLLPSILEHPEWMRPKPSWIELEIYRGCELTCSFCPRQYIDLKDNKYKDNTFMSPAIIDSIVDGLSQMPGAVTVCLGGMGEPLLHPDLKSVLQSILRVPFLFEIIIESALYPDSQKWKSILESLTAEEKSKVHFIVNISTNDPNRYKKIYGNSELSIVKENLNTLLEILPKENISVQIIKMKEVEEEVDSYFDYYEKQGINIVFQKYNRYAELMPEKRVSDLTPLNREFCWHLGRDLYVNVNGDVSICRQLPEPKEIEILGNLHQSSLIDIWAKGLPHFQNSLNGKHELIPAPCLNCDEWYTFNA
ncbi:MAG: spiro-SPASM protein [Leptospira sp.]|nr:spiro-SPASM protein [Leptospira sp.]